ncbi:NAD(P)-binding protein [Vararia minispora EC-137]|uniref:NAD(P)-binding protein n=1 Tax=Vararia minispora EC-137 TaxID=1314806 RepID=A0ACB8QN46_9AGAM|nr:NAD(P)-binding protein [Vararia minispora EC-137]
MPPRPLFVVGGLGDGSGIGAATAKLFTRSGYSVALIARGSSGTIQRLAEELNASGGDAAPFPLAAYTYTEIHRAFDDVRKHWPESELRVAVFNIAATTFKPFLEYTEADIDASLDLNIRAGYAFAREVILRQKEQPIGEHGKRGALLFTGATASLRGNTRTCAFAVGKHGLRALANSLAKEFSKQNIHVAHIVVDGVIATDEHRSNNDVGWNENPDVKLLPETIAQNYLYLANQDRSAWTFELDLRPAHEKW